MSQTFELKRKHSSNLISFRVVGSIHACMPVRIVAYMQADEYLDYCSVYNLRFPVSMISLPKVLFIKLLTFIDKYGMLGLGYESR